MKKFNVKRMKEKEREEGITAYENAPHLQFGVTWASKYEHNLFANNKLSFVNIEIAMVNVKTMNRFSSEVNADIPE